MVQKSEKNSGPRAAGIVFAIVAALPFIETLLHYSYVGNGLAPFTYYQLSILVPLVLLLAVLMAASFALQRSSVEPALQRLHESLKSQLNGLTNSLRSNLLYVFISLIALFVIYLLVGQRLVDVMRQFELLSLYAVFRGLQIAGTALIIAFVAFLLRQTSKDLKEDLSGAINDWVWGIYISIPFYVLLFIGTWRLVSLDGIHESAQLEMYFVIAKDYVLLFIITTIGYLGLYKIADARSLSLVFGTKQGYTIFVLICVIIAVFGIWADFGSLNSENLNHFFINQNQHLYYRLHIYIRDIGLLLLPISGALLWVLRQLSIEKKATDNGAVQE